MIKDVFHINVNCTNLERSKAFYELLGYQVVHELGVGGGKEMLKGLGLPEGSQAKAVIMSLNPDKPRSTRLDLIQWIDPPTKGDWNRDLSHVGAARIALWTIGIDEETARLKEAGVEFVSEPVHMGGGTRFVCFKDPDGMIIELIEFAPKGAGK